MTISFMACYLPQIYKIIKTKSSSDVSLLMMVFSFLGYVFGLLYMACTGFEIWWFLNYFSGIVTSIVLFYYWQKYK